MQDRRWDRVGALAGIAFVVVAVLAAAVTGSSIPKPDDADQVFKDFFIDKHDQLITQAWLYALAAPLLLWFGATVRRVLRKAEGDKGYLGDLFLAGTTADAALLVALMAMQVAVSNVADRLAPETVRGIGLDFGAAVVALFGFLIATTALAFAAVVLATNVLPRWTACLAVIALVLNLVGTAGVFFDDGSFSIEGGLIVFVPFLSTLLWYFGTSIAMLRARRGEATITEPMPGAIDPNPVTS
jgi:hypothetical protein